MMQRRTPPFAGFTMIELMVALAIVALILTIAAPRYFHQIDAARESALREDLYVMRDAIDKYFSDHGQYPATLDELVTARYLRAVPIDPITNTVKSWTVVPPTDGAAGTVFDVHSSAPGKARDGSLFKEW